MLNKEKMKKEKWYKYITLTKENKVNLEKIQTLEELKENQTLKYVERTLSILEKEKINDEKKNLIREVLQWSEVAKGGMPSERKKWLEKGYDLHAHNYGSADIYKENGGKDEVVYQLIRTHGMIGQQIRGEVLLQDNIQMIMKLKEKYDKAEMREILRTLNKCIIKAVSEQLWNEVKSLVWLRIEDIINESFEEYTAKYRLTKLKGEEVEEFFKEYEHHMTEEAILLLEEMMKDVQLWYVEASLKEFSVEEFLKVFLLIAKQTPKGYKHVTFEGVMNQLHYEHQGKKKINVYLKRVIEKYLQEQTIEGVLGGVVKENPHIAFNIVKSGNSYVVKFELSAVGQKLIEFCVEAEKAGVEHEKAIVLLFDLFGLRKDEYDRFHNEEKYLEQMHSNGDDKRKMLLYVKGDKILDVGPGSGIVMDMLEEEFKDKEIKGIDFSENVIVELKKKKKKEKRNWEVVKGDAFKMSEVFKEEKFDTIIYSSVIHEFYSYLEYEGKKFNIETVKEALRSAFSVLNKGGRIIIRDGVMTDSDEYVYLKMKNEAEKEILYRYQKDFKGREIQLKEQNGLFKMPINDAMEFLYTYTWGEESYVHEVKEQFGYLTTEGFVEMTEELFGDEATVQRVTSYLQEGYTDNLKDKVILYDQSMKETTLPHSTCLVVIEKQ